MISCYFSDYLYLCCLFSCLFTVSVMSSFYIVSQLFTVFINSNQIPDEICISLFQNNCCWSLKGGLRKRIQYVIFLLKKNRVSTERIVLLLNYSRTKYGNFNTKNKYVVYALNRYFIYTDKSKGLFHFRFTRTK